MSTESELLIGRVLEGLTQGSRYRQHEGGLKFFEPGNVGWQRMDSPACVRNLVACKLTPMQRIHLWNVQKAE